MNSPYKGRFKVTQIFKGAKHKGQDLVGVDSKNIYSTVTGVVEAAQYDTHPTGGMGLYIRIRSAEDSRRYYFAHLSEAYVKVGQKVTKGEPIGVEGSTGHSTGSHLHYEIRSEPDNTTYLNVSEISGIPNQIGTYEQEDKAVETKEMTTQDAINIVQDKAGLDENTIQFLLFYKYGEALIKKLATAMK